MWPKQQQQMALLKPKINEVIKREYSWQMPNAMENNDLIPKYLMVYNTFINFNPGPMDKPRIQCCGMKIQSIVKIAIIFGFLLWTAFCTLLYFGFRDELKFATIGVWMFAFMIYSYIFMATRKGQYLIKKTDGRMDQNPHRNMGLITSLLMLFVLAFFAFQIGYFTHELRRTPCESSGKCPGWSSRCPKNFIQIFAFHTDMPKCGRDEKCYPYPNEGFVERIFEDPTKARLLKRKILEMAANQTNFTSIMTIEQLELEPYFGNFLYTLDMEMNCGNVICPEKVDKLKQAFMDVYSAQIKKEQWKLQTELGRHHISEDEIDAVFVVPYSCHSLQMALAISIAFLIAHLAILAIFIRAIPYFIWLDWLTRCPYQCRPPTGTDIIQLPVEPCHHCPINRLIMDKEHESEDQKDNESESEDQEDDESESENQEDDESESENQEDDESESENQEDDESESEVKSDRPSFRSILANCLHLFKKLYNKMKYMPILSK